MTDIKYLTLELTDVAHGGLCVARHGQVVVFVRGGIPGEIVKVEVTQQRAKFWKGIVREVIQPSPHRITHPWELGAAGYTGAADFGHIVLPMQRCWKARMLENQVKRIGGEQVVENLLDLLVKPVVLSTSKDMRVSAEKTQKQAAIVAKDKDKEVAFAVPADIFSIPVLEVAAVSAGQEWQTRSRIELTKLEHGFGMYREQSHELLPLSQMLLAKPELEAMLFGEKAKVWNDLIKAGTRVKAVASSGGELRLVAGESVFAWDLGRLEATRIKNEYVQEIVWLGEKEANYQVSASGFWQIHRYAPQALVEVVLDFWQSTGAEKVVELFAGAGLFTKALALASGGALDLRTYELGEKAVTAARHNLRDYKNVQIEVAHINADNIKDLVGKSSLLLADPPRAGLGNAAIDALADTELEAVILVSCDPASMARDLRRFRETGWQITRFQALDIFPHTHHVETVALLSKNTSASK